MTLLKYLNFNPFGKYSRVLCTGIARSAKQQSASLMKRPSTPKSVSKRKFDDKSYDSTERKRKFIPHWHNLFPWLEYNSDEEITFYVTCRKLPLHADNTNFQVESLKTHATSTHHHLYYSKIKQELHPTNLQDTRLGQAVIQIHEKKRIELESLVRTAYIISHTRSPHLMTSGGPVSFNSSMV